MNLRSRDNARTPFPWNGEKYGGFSEETPWLEMTEEYPKINANAQVGQQGSIYEFYREMIAYRQSGPHRDTLIYGAIEPVETGDDVIAYRRYTDGDPSAVCSISAGKSVRRHCPQRMELRCGATWIMYLWMEIKSGFSPIRLC